MNLREAGLVTYWDGSLILIHTIFGLEDASCLAALLQVGIETAEGEGLSPIDVFFSQCHRHRFARLYGTCCLCGMFYHFPTLSIGLILHTLQAKRKDTVTSSKSSTDQCRLVGLQIQPAAGDGIVGGNWKRQLCSDSGDCCGDDTVSKLISLHVEPGVLASTVLQSVGQGSVGGGSDDLIMSFQHAWNLTPQILWKNQRSEQVLQWFRSGVTETALVFSYSLGACRHVGHASTSPRRSDGRFRSRICAWGSHITRCASVTFPQLSRSYAWGNLHSHWPRRCLRCEFSLVLGDQFGLFRLSRCEHEWLLIRSGGREKIFHTFPHTNFVCDAPYLCFSIVENWFMLYFSHWLKHILKWKCASCKLQVQICLHVRPACQYPFKHESVPSQWSQLPWAVSFASSENANSKDKNITNATE